MDSRSNDAIPSGNNTWYGLYNSISTNPSNVEVPYDDFRFCRKIMQDKNLF